MRNRIQPESQPKAEPRDHVYQAIKAAIRDARYLPGEYLREQQIAESLGVSRTPVREAFRRLAAEGWLEARPNHGVLVRSWSVDDVEEIFEARALLEPYLAAQAATRMDEAGIAELRRLAQEMREIAQDTPTPESTQAWFDANGAFHDLLLDGAANARLVQALRSMKEMPLIKWTFRNFSVEDRQRAVRQHFEIAQAVEQRDAALTEAIMKSHILAAQASVLRQMKGSGGGPGLPQPRQ